MSRSQLTSASQILESRLIEAGIGTERFVPITEGKISYDHTAHSLEEITGSYGVLAGDRLAFVDVDNYESVPDSLDDLSSTFTVETPHGGKHMYYRTSVAVSNSTEEWGEIRANNLYVLGPGSKLLDCDGGCCTESSPGKYKIATDRPIAEVDAEQLVKLTTETENQTSTRTTSSDTIDAELSNLTADRDSVAMVESSIREFRTDDRTTPRAFDYLMDLVQGRYAKRGFDGDRSAAETTLAALLYGVLRSSNDEENAIERVYAYISDACETTRYTDDGQVRKWVARSDRYRICNVIEPAMGNFDPEKWERWQQKRANGRKWTDEYSDITYDYVLKAVRTAFEDRPGYPSRDDIVSVAQGLDPDRSYRTHENTLRRLQRDYGQVKMAHCGSNTYVYYPASERDPPNAKWVKSNGECQTI